MKKLSSRAVTLLRKLSEGYRIEAEMVRGGIVYPGGALVLSHYLDEPLAAAASELSKAGLLGYAVNGAGAAFINDAGLAALADIQLP